MLRKSMEKLLLGADLPGEIVPGQPLLELAGNTRALIEGHSGVLEYGSERIRVRVKFGNLCISGRELELVRMSGDQLVILGQIEAVVLEGGG